MLFAAYVCSHIFSYVWVTEWPPIGKIAAHSAYDMFQCIVPNCSFWFFPTLVLEWESLFDCGFS